jgi:hypothetical protein
MMMTNNTHNMNIQIECVNAKLLVGRTVFIPKIKNFSVARAPIIKELQKNVVRFAHFSHCNKNG